MYFTIKFCWSGDQEYITGTEATAFRVLRGMTCLENSAKPLSTVHWKMGDMQNYKNGAISRIPCLHRVCRKWSWAPTSLVPRSELTGVMMCTGWIRRSFHSWLRMSVRSRIFCRLELNMLCRRRRKRKRKKKKTTHGFSSVWALPTFSPLSTPAMNIVCLFVLLPF